MSSLPAWNAETIYHDGDQFFSDLGQALMTAKKSITLETYIFDRDPIGTEILRHLYDAVVRGVRVRVLLDGIGCSDWSYRDLEHLLRANVEARFYHPLPWQQADFTITRYFAPRRILFELWKLNRRNHRKVCVIDERIGFLGGLNLSARHSRKVSGRKVWRDTSVRVTGDSVESLVEAFDFAWTLTADWGRFRKRWLRYRRLPFRAGLVRLNVTRKQRRGIYRDLIRRIRSSRDRIWITNPYFIPHYTLIRALRSAALGGVDVRLLFSKRSDIWGIKWAIRAFYYILLSSKVQIFEYHASILHAKTLLIDSWATVGSSNLNHRSLFQDLEVDVVLSRSSSVGSIEEQFLKDLESSDQIELRKWQRRSWIQRVLERVALVFKKWL